MALKEYNNALKLHPRNSTYLNNKANVLREMGRLGDAARTYKLALQSNPTNSRYWCNLAKVYNENDRFRDAEMAAREALKIDEINIEALNNLALSLERQNKPQEALKIYESALTIDPKNSIVNNNIGKLYFSINEIEKSVNFINKSISLNPNLVEPYYNLCEIYDKTNRLKQFSETLALVPIKFKKDPTIQLKRGQLKFRNKKYSQSIHLLKEIDVHKLSITKRSILFELLGKSFDSLGKFDQAFLNFSRMNENSSKIANNIGIHPTAYKDNIESLIHYFQETPYTFQNKSQKKETNSPIFIIGFPRSGTTLLDTILRSHPRIAVIEEEPLIDRLVSTIDKPISPSTISKFSPERLIELRKLYKEETKKLLEPNQEGKMIIDKFPLNIIHIPLMNALFPESKYILMLRHPYDCVLSSFMQNFDLNEAMANFLTIKNTVSLYSNVMKLWSLYSAQLILNVEIVKYEKLISNFEQTSKNILNFLDLEWDDKLFKFYETGKARNKIMTPSYHQVTEKIYTHASDRWRNYSEALSTDVNLLKPWLSYFSYES